MKMFPLDQWSDTTKPITKAEAAITAAQMMLNALKQGDDPDSPESKAAYREMRNAVNAHNKKFQ